MQCLHMSNPCLRSPACAFTSGRSSRSTAQCCPARRVTPFSVRAANETDSQPEASTSGLQSCGAACQYTANLVALLICCLCQTTGRSQTPNKSINKEVICGMMTIVYHSTSQMFSYEQRCIHCSVESVLSMIATTVGGQVCNHLCTPRLGAHQESSFQR